MQVLSGNRVFVAGIGFAAGEPANDSTALSRSGISVALQESEREIIPGESGSRSCTKSAVPE